MFNNAPFLFQQDDAPAHIAKTTQEWLRTNSHTNLESLKQSLSREWYQIRQETLQMAIEAVPTRLRAVIKEKADILNKRYK